MRTTRSRTSSFSTTSPWSTAGPMESTTAVSITPSQEGSAPQGGTGLKNPSGGEMEPPALKLETASQTSLSTSSSGITGEIQASFQNSISENILTLLLSDEHCDIIDEAALVEKLIAIRAHETKWDRRVDNEYNGGQARKIRSLHNLLLNIVNGFGDRNGPGRFDRQLRRDTTGNLIKEATVGVKWSKKGFLTAHLFTSYLDYVHGKKKLSNKRKLVMWPRILDCDNESEDMDRLLQVNVLSLCYARAAAKKSRSS